MNDRITPASATRLSEIELLVALATPNRATALAARRCHRG